MKCYFFFLIGFLSFSSSSSLTAEDKIKIRNVIEHTMKCKDLPGVILTVIDKNSVEMTEGFGKLDLNSPSNLVDGHTRFSLGSVSKAFTATLLSKVLRNSNFNLDSLVKEIIPDIDFGTEIHNEHATIRDILAHKLGFLNYGSSWMVGLELNYDRQDYCKRLRNLKSIGFRRKFKYNNFMYLLSSCLVERITGKTFEQALQEHIYDPLNMTETDSTSNFNNWDWKKFASPHSFDVIENKTKRLERRVIETVSPAEGSGGVFTTARDMANWMLMNLNDGMFNGKRIIDEDLIREFHSPLFSSDVFYQMFVRKPFFPVESMQTSYGMGWYVGTYGGYRLSSHPGSISGFNSLLYLFPDIKSGVFIGGNSFTMHESLLALTYYVSDLLQGREPFINLTTACTFPEPWSSNLPIQGDQMRTPGRAPPVFKVDKINKLKRSIEKYSGSYGHPLFGNLTIWFDEENQQIMGKTGHIGYAKLYKTNNESLLNVELTGPLEYVKRSPYYVDIPTPLIFKSEVDGKYQEVENWPMEPEDPVIYKRGLWWET